MTNEEYLDVVFSLFGDTKKVILSQLVMYTDNILDTSIIAYACYHYNLLHSDIASVINHEKIVKNVKGADVIKSDYVESANIIVSYECKYFIDKLLKFTSNPVISSSRQKQNLYSIYMGYLFLSDNRLSAYKLFYKCINSSNISHIKDKLENSLMKAFLIPDNQTFSMFGRFLTNPLIDIDSQCIGRDKELSNIIDILSRKTKNNPILVGQPGVGKTAILEGLAQLLMSNKCPKQFIGYHIYEVSLATLISGSRYRGDFEEKLTNLLKAVSESPAPIILFIDEIHTIMSGGKSSSDTASMSCADILKPYMSRPNFLLIGATTQSEYKYIENDSALNRRFNMVKINEPSDETVSYILSKILFNYEKHFNITIPSNLISDIIYYANRCISNKYMPDKAIDLLDESCVYCINHSHNNEMTVDDIISAVEIITGITVPVRGINISNKVTNVINNIKHNIVGQNEAVDTISAIIKRYYLGFATDNKPIGSCLFVGPTGVGKTQLCKELANNMFTNESFIRFDMSEFMESHAVSKLIGSPPGYVGYGEGGLLTEAVKHNPHSVILFDEIEKAHQDIYNILLQILDDGRLTDSEGVTVDFSNCIIILTSNIGTTDIAEKSISTIGFGSNELTNKDVINIYNKAIKKQFKPELINRIDRIVYFNSLTKSDIAKIVDIQIAELVKKYCKSNIIISVSDEARTMLYEKCYLPEYGARYAQRLIISDVEEKIISYMLDNDLVVSSDRLNIDVIICDGDIKCKLLDSVNV